MASRGRDWRRRIEHRLALRPPDADARTALLERVIGQPSPELEQWLAGPSTQAAVLIGLIERAAGPTVLLTERAAHLPHHPGQISFPGGRVEAGEQPLAAALREAREEVGLHDRQVEVLGSLRPQLTGTGFVVTPIVGWLTAAFEPAPNPDEVAAAFEVPVEHLLSDVNRRRRSGIRWGTRFVTDEFHFERHRIWGATATILENFLEVIDAKTI